MIDPDDERGGAAFVFPADPQVVGAARAMAARGEGRLLEVAGIHFVPEAHGTGIAQHMWGMAARWALTEMGARATVVLTVRDNTRAVEFYRRKMKATGEVEFTKVFLGKEQSEVLFKYDHAAMLEHATLCE
ncbi:hypothetical protein GQ42DRAFT_21505 [Ramicandelaber brevisporus]|nr:hypothetical protein GQ42DRAFT_21505 [Ramicandelaber brevisporus]